MTVFRNHNRHVLLAVAALLLVYDVAVSLLVSGLIIAAKYCLLDSRFMVIPVVLGAEHLTTILMLVRRPGASPRIA